MGYWWILILAKKDWLCSIITYGWYLLFTAPVISPLHFEDFVFDELKIHFSFLVCHELLDGKVVLLEVGPLLLQVVELRKHKGVFVNKWRHVKILPILIFFITYCLSFKIQTLSLPEEHDWPKCLKNQKLSLRKKKFSSILSYYLNSRLTFCDLFGQQLKTWFDLKTKEMLCSLQLQYFDKLAKTLQRKINFM